MFNKHVYTITALLSYSLNNIHSYPIYGILENSYKAMYELIDLLSPETAAMVASENYIKLLEEQPPTDYQIKEIENLTKQLNIKDKRYRLNKRQANELIFSLEKKQVGSMR